jgi:hypothetical protein
VGGGSHIRTEHVEAPPTPPPSASTLPTARKGSRGERKKQGCLEKDHGFHFKKFEIRARPKRWLFSGWNWVPIAVSLPTIAVTGPP